MIALFKLPNILAVVPGSAWIIFGSIWIHPTMELFSRGQGRPSTLLLTLLPITVGIISMLIPALLSYKGKNISALVSSAVSTLAFIAYFFVIATLSAI